MAVVNDTHGATDGGALLMASLVLDVAEWVDCTWAVAVSYRDGQYHPVCICGTPPNLEASLRFAGLAAVSDWFDPECMEGAICDWMPNWVVPVRVRGTLRGMLILGHKRGSAAYTVADRELILEAAGNIASLLESERLAGLIGARLADLRSLHTDLQAARSIQMRFLPNHLPRIEGLDYYGDCRPAGAVGGDFFDFVPFQKQGLIVSVGDVTGHGISSAIMMSGLQAYLRGLSMESRGDITKVVDELNRTVCTVSPDNFFATLFYASIDIRRGELQYVSAGHEAALLIRKNTNRVLRLESTGTVLGLTERSAFGRRKVPFSPGDLLIAFTDGVSESEVLNVVRDHPHVRTSELVAYVMDAMGDFDDDRTVVALRLNGRTEPVFDTPFAQLAATAA